MREIMILITLALLVMGLTACGGGSGLAFPDSGGVVQCAEEYNPIEVDLEESDKVSKVSWPESNSTDRELPAGEYEYAGMEFFFIDTSTGFKFHTTEVKADNGEFEIKRVCGRNALALKPMKLEMEYPTAATVGASGKTTAKTKVLTIEYTDRLMVTISEPTDQAEPPSKVTDDQNFDSQLYETKTLDNEVIYEYRMEDVSGPVKKFALIRYKKVAEPTP